MTDPGWLLIYNLPLFYLFRSEEKGIQESQKRHDIFTISIFEVSTNLFHLNMSICYNLYIEDIFLSGLLLLKKKWVANWIHWIPVYLENRICSNRPSLNILHWFVSFPCLSLLINNLQKAWNILYKKPCINLQWTCWW